MSRDFVGALLQLNAEKQVSREQLIRTVEEAIAAAYRRVADEEDIHVHIDVESGAIRVYRARIATTDPIDEDQQLTHFTLDEAQRSAVRPLSPALQPDDIAFRVGDVDPAGAPGVRLGRKLRSGARHSPRGCR